VRTDADSVTTLGGRYRLVRCIGAGGMGAVWEAEDELLGRRVAVKMLAQPLRDNDAVAERFRREAQAAARLTHPNIAQVFDYGEDDGCPYIVLELVPGRTLRSLLERRGPLPPEEVAGVGAQIAEALAAAHERGVVHRDVKPGNVMVDPEGRVKVMDFGIAQAAWFEPLTDTGTIMATALYLSPEQATGGAATGASDVYSLGAVLYELFAGHLPFDGDSPFAIAHAHAYEVPEPLVEAAPGVPPAMRAAVEAAMAKDARERPTAAELATALRASIASPDTSVLPEPVAPASALVSAGASERRAGWLLGGLAALVLLLAVAFLALAGPGRGAATGGRHTRAPAERVDHAGPAPAADRPSPKPKPEPKPEHKDPRGEAHGHDEHGPGEERPG
jgi:serine/threonine-protein kinase